MPALPLSLSWDLHYKCNQLNSWRTRDWLFQFFFGEDYISLLKQQYIRISSINQRKKSAFWVLLFLWKRQLNKKLIFNNLHPFYLLFLLKNGNDVLILVSIQIRREMKGNSSSLGFRKCSKKVVFFNDYPLPCYYGKIFF